MNVIAKMSTTSVEDYGNSRKFRFNAIHDSNLNIGDNPENRAFTKATPWGEAAMTVDNKNVWDAFRIPSGDGSDEHPYRKGTQHYVVFIDAEEHTLEDVYRALASLGKEDA